MRVSHLPELFNRGLSVFPKVSLSRPECIRGSFPPSSTCPLCPWPPFGVSVWGFPVSSAPGSSHEESLSFLFPLYTPVPFSIPPLTTLRLRFCFETPRRGERHARGRGRPSWLVSPLHPCTLEAVDNTNREHFPSSFRILFFPQEGSFEPFFSVRFSPGSHGLFPSPISLPVSCPAFP